MSLQAAPRGDTQAPELHTGQALKQASLHRQVQMARFWLPLLIAGVVLLLQLVVLPLGGETWRFWVPLLFYSIVGPAVTFLTLNWIATQAKERERAQNELSRLYTELRASHEFLRGIQKVTERFAAATDLDTVLTAASAGVAEVTGAKAVAVSLGYGNLGVLRGHNLNPALRKDALGRAEALRHGETLSPRLEPEGLWALSAPLIWAEKLEGSVHAYYSAQPSAEARESFSILLSQLSAAAEANRSRTRDLLTLFEVDRSIRAEGNLERLLETLLTQTMQRAGASLGGVYLADEDGLLQLKAWSGLDIAPSPERLGAGLVGMMAAREEPVILHEMSEGERQVAGALLAEAKSVVSLPLLTDEGLIGVIILAHRLPDHFSESSLPFLSLMARQVTLAVRNARAYLHSEELAIAEERARIAREIHDGIAQSLAFTALKLDLVAKLMNSQPEKASVELDGTKRTIRETIKELRRSIFALRPVDLERHGFLETIRRYSVDFGQQNDVRVELEIVETPKLTLKSEAVLFRIFQEALNNVAKHSGAKQVTITVGTSDEGHGFVAISDDGQGFDLSSVTGRITSAGGLGLVQMHERIEARRGSFSITSAPGQGTTVYAAVPE